jgi:uncharacterized membrane protein (DUF373 family)
MPGIPKMDKQGGCIMEPLYSALALGVILGVLGVIVIFLLLLEDVEEEEET